MVADMAFWHKGILALAALFLVAAALGDARRYRISNVTSFGLLILFLPYVLTSSQPIAWHQHLAICGLVLVAGFIMYVKKYVGAGDVKLLVASSLWAGMDLVGLLLFITALTGGLLAILTAGLAYYRHHKNGAKTKLTIKKIPIPYGVAIALGGLCTLMVMSEAVLLP